MSRTRHSVILTTSINGLVPVLVLVAVVVTFRGHNAPGGGFAGGLIVSAAVILRYLADGPRAVERLPVQPMTLVGAGLCLAVAVAAAPLFVGGEVLESYIWTVSIPAIGKVKVVSSAGFDLGVFLLVIGSVTSMLVAFVEADDAEDPDVVGTDILAPATEPSDSPAAEPAAGPDRPRDHR
ncbi:MAG: MnhB domain-containing protein [Microthrixaceae bacterium]